MGLDQTQVPDFLGLETNTLQSFLEADQVSNEELRNSIDQDLAEWRYENPSDDYLSTERVLLGTARVGQTQFARSVLLNYNVACVFCGLGFRSAGLPSSRMLVASHIKPWQKSDNNERRDTSNGVAACPTHDAAFDSFMISLSPQLDVIISSTLAGAISNDLQVARNFGPDGMYARVVLDGGQAPPAEKYIRWHFEEASAREVARASVRGVDYELTRDRFDHTE